MSWPRLFPVLCLALLLLAPVERPNAQEKTTASGDKKPDGPASATIRVKLPAKARLLFDDHETQQTGGERLFETPPLEPGKTFQYTLKATWKSDPKREADNITRMAVARVRAGKETVVDMTQESPDATSSQVIYLPTPQNVVDKMLDMAKVTKDDIVYDLGCGDGRIVVTAAKKFGAKGVGIDIDPERIKESLANVKKAQVEKLVEIRQGDALKVPDLSKATVVTLYMLPQFMEKLKPILLKELKPGTRIVAHDYPVPGWEPRERVTVERKIGFYPHTLYLWHVPGKKE